MEKVISQPNPATSISEVKLEIVRKRANKEKRKSRAFIRYEKRYKNNEYFQKSLVKFLEPKSVKGTGLLSWTKEEGYSDQWFFLPKLKIAKKVKSKEKSKSFMSTDFIYEDLENRNPLLDSLSYLGSDFINGEQCAVVMAWPKNNSIYHSRKIWTNNSTWQVCKIEFYKKESVLDKTLILSEFIFVDEYTTPTRMEMRKANGSITVMKIRSFQPGIGFNEEIFSKSLNVIDLSLIHI